MKTVSVIIPDSFESLTPDQLGLLIQQGKDLTKLFKAAEAFAKARLTAGSTITGWTMGPGKREREWLSDEHAKTALAAQGINDFYKPQELLSVAEAEKKVADIEKLKSAWRWVDGAKTLKPATVSASLAASARPDFGF